MKRTHCDLCNSINQVNSYQIHTGEWKEPSCPEDKKYPETKNRDYCYECISKILIHVAACDEKGRTYILFEITEEGSDIQTIFERMAKDDELGALLLEFGLESKVGE